VRDEEPSLHYVLDMFGLQELLKHMHRTR